jgi:hypothetical protein
MAVYGAGLLATAVAAARRAPLRDAAALPAVFATMHAAWGSGLAGGRVGWSAGFGGLRTAGDEGGAARAWLARLWAVRCGQSSCEIAWPMGSALANGSNQAVWARA